MNDHPIPRGRRSSSAGRQRQRQSVIQVRASSFVKKLGLLTSKFGSGPRIKADSTTQDHDQEHENESHPYRKTRSMDVLRSKPYMSTPILAVGFQSQPQALARASQENDSGSASGSGSEIDAGGGDRGREHAKKPSVSSDMSSSSIAHDLAMAAFVAETSLRSPEASSPQFKPKPPPQAPSNGTSTTTNAAQSQSQTSDSPPPPTKRPVHPRLSTLPPLNFNLKGPPDQFSQRFSPSVIVRPPPFPILELPALPTPVAENSSFSLSSAAAAGATGAGAAAGGTQARTRRGAARLNSMPMLPMEGADERENDPDHENYGLEEEEEDDDDVEGPGETAGSDDEEEDRVRGHGRGQSTPSTPTGFFARTRALSPRLPLPTPSISFSKSILGSVGVGIGASSSSSSHHQTSGTADPTRTASASANAKRDDRDRDTTTPKATSPTGTGHARWDYFSTSFAPAGDQKAKDKDGSFFSNSGLPSPSTTALRTPTARDYPPSVVQSQTPMTISVAPPPWTQPGSGVSGSESSDVRTMKGSLTSKNADVPHLTVGLGEPTTTTKRPNIYHHASKSMVELFSSPLDANTVGDVKGKGKGRAEDLATDLQILKGSPVKGRINGPAGKTDADGHTLLSASSEAATKPFERAAPSAPTPTTLTAEPVSPSLRRQRSMPTFSASGPPPPYPSFLLPEHLRRFAPMPREDEGKEALPSYSNDIRLTAIMPRKMEFNAPGVPARDRKWRRVHCVLEGTAFRVYDAPPRVTGVSALGGWWERKVGVGDVSIGQGGAASATATQGATTNLVIGKKEPKRRMKWEEELQAEEEARVTGAGSSEEPPQQNTTEVNLGNQVQGHRSKRNLAASLLHPNRSRISLARAPSPSSASPRSSFQTPRSSADSSFPPSSFPSSARPSMDISTPVSSSSAFSSAAASASSSTSGLSIHSGGSSPGEQTQARRRGHVRSDSTQSSNGRHSRSQSRSLLPDSQGSNLSANQSQSSLALPEPEEKDLIRLYSLQRSESGLASDYTKRKNVVRVRMEGEQFLLQCTDVAGVVEWIEGLQAATNIALDLDERPMPKGPIFPRRRRRRRVQRTESGTDVPISSAGAAGGGEPTTS